MKNFLQLAEEIKISGLSSDDRTGVGTLALFGKMLDFPLIDKDVQPITPLVTTRKVPHRSFVVEDKWFLSGSTDVKFLKDNGVSIWDDWVIPSTAVFKETDKQTAQDMSTWLRCVRPSIYQEWKKFQAGRGNPVETIEDIQKFILDRKFMEKGPATDIGNGVTIWPPKLVEIPKVALASGSIGEGAYGALWRRWEDTRIVTLKDAEEQHYKNGYKYVCHIPPSSAFGAPADAESANVVITRNVDQIRETIKLLRSNPDSRRIIVTAWNPGRIQDAVLPPCHSFFTFNTRVLSLMERFLVHLSPLEVGLRNPEDALIYMGHDPLTITASDAHAMLDQLGVPRRALTLMLVCRSQDFLVGSVFNIAQYGVLAHLIARSCNMVAERLVWVGSNVHIYKNQLGEELLDKQLSREPLDQTARVVIAPHVTDIDNFEVDDVQIVGYQSHGVIKYPIAV